MQGFSDLEHPTDNGALPFSDNSRRQTDRKVKRIKRASSEGTTGSRGDQIRTAPIELFDRMLAIVMAHPHAARGRDLRVNVQPQATSQPQ